MPSTPEKPVNTKQPQKPAVKKTSGTSKPPAPKSVASKSSGAGKPRAASSSRTRVQPAKAAPKSSSNGRAALANPETNAPLSAETLPVPPIVLDASAAETAVVSQPTSADEPIADIPSAQESANTPAAVVPVLSIAASTTAEPDDDFDFGSLSNQLMALQQQIKAAQVPVVLIFEGWDTAGKGTMISKLIEGLDPRGYQVYPIRRPDATEVNFPQMRRYWVDMPSAGNISIFCGSWYREVTLSCFEDKDASRHLPQTYQEIIAMESALVSDGALIIKFFLHIPRKEQKRRLKELQSKKNTRWRVDKEDLEQNEHYDEYLELFDTMIARTHLDGAQWHVLRSDNKRACVKQIFDTLIAEFQTAIADRASNKRIWDKPYLPNLDSLETITFPLLETFDPEQALTDPYKPAVDKAQKRLRKLQNELYRRGIPMVICFEGWDAAGKGGAIRRLTAALDPRSFDVIPIASPTPLEKAHHHLWRFWKALPPNGHIAIFDRTWYGRAMVERIEGYCTEAQWMRSYDEFNRFEGHLTASGTILLKFWLQIDTETQLARFNDRKNDPEKQWKITDEDWRNREKWPQYEAAVNEMLQKTNTAFAPWTVVEANNKQFARLKVLDSVIQAIEARLRNHKE